MPTAYLYVLGASPNPDRVECAVPWRVDDDEIFFGPCKIPLREKLRPELLGPKRDRGVPDDDLYFVGFNALGNGSRRCIVWAGRMREAMSFGRAWLDLTGPRYEKMRDEQGYSPVHLEPLDGSGRPTGYRQRGKEHFENHAWLDDILGDETKAGAIVAAREVRLLPHRSWWTGFPRDICFRFENIFFATDGGLEIDDELVALLAHAQSDKKGVDSVAVFGLNAAGKREGRRGRWLELRGDDCDRFVSWLHSRTGRKPGSRRTRPTTPMSVRRVRGCR